MLIKKIKKHSAKILLPGLTLILLPWLTLLLISSFQSGIYAQGETTFSNIPENAGVKIFRPTYGDPIWGDYDNDGFLDVFVINHGHYPSLFHNNGNGTFTDVRAASGIVGKKDRHGAAWGDFDNDGDLDLYISVGANHGTTVGYKSDELYRNDGGGIFTNITVSAGVANAFGRGRGVHFVDYNKDGYLDLSVMNAATSKNVLYKNNGNGTFTDVAPEAGIANISAENAAWFDYNNDGYMDMFVSLATPDQLWRNNGNGTFTNVTTLAGIASKLYSYGVALGDYDNDKDTDIYVTRGYSDVKDSVEKDASNIYFSDQESASYDGLDFQTSGASVTFNLYLDGKREPPKVFYGGQKIAPLTIPFSLTEEEANGAPSYAPGQDTGFFIWHDTSGWHIRWSSDAAVRYFYGIIHSDNIGSVQTVNYKRKNPSSAAITNTLYRNNGNGTFSDITASLGIGWNQFGSTQNDRSAAWGDFDNDGDLDLYLVKPGSFRSNIANRLFKNNGDGSFTDVAGSTNTWVNSQGRGNSASWGDYNNDGFLDIYVLNGWGVGILDRLRDNNNLVFGPHILLKNNGNTNNWIKIKLTGTASNRDALGAKVTLKAGELTQYRELAGHGGGYLLAQGKGPLHFGLGNASIINSVTIEWPSGRTQVLTNITSNQIINITEP